MRRIDSKSAGAQRGLIEKSRPMKVYLSENAFMGCIVISILSHLLFAGLLGITSSSRQTSAPIFNVDIVSPIEDRIPTALKKIPLLTGNREPAIVKQRPDYRKKQILPDTLYGEGAGLSPQVSDKQGSLKPPDRADDHSLMPPAFLFDKKTIEKFARKGSPARKGLTFDTSEFKHRGYMRMLKEKIEGIWKYPEEAARLGLSGDLYMKFSIKSNGEIGEIELLRTSGYSALDEAAAKALKDAEPYWPLPENWEKETLEIKGHFIYILGRTYVM